MGGDLTSEIRTNILGQNRTNTLHWRSFVDVEPWTWPSLHNSRRKLQIKLLKYWWWNMWEPSLETIRLTKIILKTNFTSNIQTFWKRWQDLIDPNIQPWSPHIWNMKSHRKKYPPSHHLPVAAPLLRWHRWNKWMCVFGTHPETSVKKSWKHRIIYDIAYIYIYQYIDEIYIII